MKKIFIAVAIAAVAMSSLAHAPFTAPSNYVVNGDNTSILAGFAEHPFDSEVAIRGFDFQVVNPKGESTPLTFSNTASLSSANVESKLDGTYQIIGQRSAAIQYVKDGKRWLRVLDARGANVPPLSERDFILPTEITTQQQKLDVTRVDRLLSFFSKYQHSDLVAVNTQSGLNFNYSLHPNLIKTGQTLGLSVQLKQKAAAGYQVLVERQHSSLTDKTEPLKLVTNAQGVVNIPFKLAGQYILTVSSPETKEYAKPEAETYRSFLSIYVN